NAGTALDLEIRFASEDRASLDIFDNHAPSCLEGGSAGAAPFVDAVPVLQPPRGETTRCDDPQLAGLLIEQLKASEVRIGERDRRLDDLPEYGIHVALSQEQRADPQQTVRRVELRQDS